MRLLRARYRYIGQTDRGPLRKSQRPDRSAVICWCYYFFFNLASASMPVMLR